MGELVSYPSNGAASVGYRYRRMTAGGPVPHRRLG
jgi:hypothetical protein